MTTRTETARRRAMAAVRAAAAAPPETARPRTYSYFANFAVGAVRRPRSAHLRASGPTASRSIVAAEHARSITGSEDQSADPLIVAKEGADNAPAYRGLAYVVFERLPVGGFRQPHSATCRSRSCGRSARLEANDRAR